MNDKTSVDRAPVDAVVSESGVVAHVVIHDGEAHRQLLELCNEWHRMKPNSMFIDWEQSEVSYSSLRANEEQFRSR